MAKSRVRRLYLPFGDAFFLTTDAPGVDGYFLEIDTTGVDGVVGTGVICFCNTVGGIRFIDVDDPNATTVDFACKIRLIRAEPVNATKDKSVLTVFVS